MAWIKITYRDGWYPEGNTCVLTNAEADGRWSGEKYAIFSLNERPHVAFWPTKPIILKSEEVSKRDAERLLRETINGNTLRPDFEKTYGETKENNHLKRICETEIQKIPSQFDGWSDWDELPF